MLPPHMFQCQVDDNASSVEKLHYTLLAAASDVVSELLAHLCVQVLGPFRVCLGLSC
jgi:hypothetical protein